MSMEHEHKVTLGLGEAITRLLEVEARLRNSLGSQDDLVGFREERSLLMDALNSHQLELGLACSLDHSDEVPEGPDRFNKMAVTSCCRISLDNVRDGTTPVSSTESVTAESTTTESAPKKRTIKSGSRL